MGGRALALATKKGTNKEMRITVHVKPSSRRDQVTIGKDGVYIVRVAVPPIEGRANRRLIELLAEHFGRPKSSIQIVTGLNSKHKMVEIT